MPNLTLETVEKSFIHWRNIRRSRSEQIPQTLWAMVSNIAADYKHSEICTRLRLSGSQFKDRAIKSKPHVGQPHFVVATQPAESKNIATPVTLSLKGYTRTLSLSVSMADLGVVLPHFGALL